MFDTGIAERRVTRKLDGISRTVSLTANPRLAEMYEDPPEELRYDWRKGVAAEPSQMSVDLSRGAQPPKLMRDPTV